MTFLEVIKRKCKIVAVIFDVCYPAIEINKAGGVNERLWKILNSDCMPCQ